MKNPYKPKTMTNDYEKLSEDAYAQAHTNFHKAIDTIDKEFGEGFAKKNPILIQALVQASSIEYSGVIQALKVQELTVKIDEMNSVLRDAVDAMQNI